MENIKTSINNSLNQMVTNKVIEVAEDYGNRLVSYIKYEYVIAQMELASSWKDHGYNFKFLPEQFIQNIRTNVTESDSGVNMKLIIPSENFKGEDQDKIDFFSKYVVDNAVSRLRR